MIRLPFASERIQTSSPSKPTRPDLQSNSIAIANLSPYGVARMCVAGLNVSTQPCSHRWYQLLRACDPEKNLANCPERLRLEGWETRYETCPWCNDSEKDVHISTHRLFGSTSSTSSTTISPTSPELMGAARTHRSGSGGTLSSLSRHSSCTSVESERGQRHRDMNERLNLYLTMSPHEVLPSARKNYPTYTSSPVDESSTSDAASMRSATGLFGKGWKKSVRFSKGMLRG